MEFAPLRKASAKGFLALESIGGRKTTIYVQPPQPVSDRVPR